MWSVLFFVLVSVRRPRHLGCTRLLTFDSKITQIENKMKAGFSLFRRFGSVYGDGSEASTMTTYRFRINDGDIMGGEGRGGGSPEPAYNETKASILRRRNTMAKMIHEEEQAAIQVFRILNL